MSITANQTEILKDLNAYQLANLADCGTPDTLESAGAAFLTGVRNAVIEALEYDDTDPDPYADYVYEIADGAPSIYTFTMWQEFVDLAAWQQDIDDLGNGETDLNKLGVIALYEIARTLTTALIERVIEEGESE